MRREIILVFLFLLLLLGCSFDGLANQNKAIVIEKDGNIQFDLSVTASILVKSNTESDGISITDLDFIKDISGKLSTFKSYEIKGGYIPEYQYSLTFYDTAGKELTTINVYDNFIISCNGKFYYDQAEQLYIWPIRKAYLEKAKSTYSRGLSSFHINGKEYDMRKLDSRITSITKDTWLGDADWPEPSLILECYISPDVKYCAVFDVEKMDFVFKGSGTTFIYKNDSTASLVYVQKDKVYNYLGDILYQNRNNDYYISKIKYDKGADNDTVSVTLANKKGKKQINTTCINYRYKKGASSEFDSVSSSDSTQLAEFNADLTHDGGKDKLNIYKTKEAGDLAFLELTDSKGKTTRLEYAHTSHAGWNSVYLCKIKQKEYLLVFNPYECTGQADFMYVVYSITSQGTMEIIDSNSYSFSEKKGTTNSFNEKKFRTFAKKVNAYLKNSYLLMSTENGELKYSTKDNCLAASDQYKTEKWLKEIEKGLY